MRKKSLSAMSFPGYVSALFFIFCLSFESVRALPYNELKEKIASSTSFSLDSARVIALLDRGNYLIDYNTDSASEVLNTAIAISKRLNYHFGIARGNQLAGVIFSDKGKYSEARDKYTIALQHYSRISDYRGIAAINNNLGNLHNFQGFLDDAASCYLSAVTAFERVGEIKMLSLVYTNLGSVFEKLNQPDKSLIYHNKAVAISVSLKDSSRLIHALVNRGIAYSKLNRKDDAMRSFLLSLQLSRGLNNAHGIGISNQNIGDLYESAGQLDSALYYFSAARKELILLNDPYYTSAINFALGSVYFQLNKLTLAEEFIQRSIKEAIEINEKEILAKAYYRLSELYSSAGNLPKSLDALKQYKFYDDSLRSESTIRQVNILETRFRTAEKDKEIAGNQLALTLKENELRKKNSLIGLSILAMLIFAVISMLVYRTYRQEKSLRAQQILTLQKENKIIALQAMMDGEEKERMRLAADLHDGVGGLLSAAKLRVHSLNKHFSGISVSPSFREAVEILDEAATELRKTAHNLMPQVLFNYGLEEGIRNFCNKVSPAGKLMIDYQIYGSPVRFTHRFELMVYRIVQELIHNIVKHAAATSVILQVSFTENLLAVTVEDNGIGFDPEEIRSEKGIGLGSLYSRVEAIGGRLDIQSLKGVGTSVYLEVKTSNQNL